MADVDRCLFHFSTVQSSPVKSLFEVLKDILHDVIILFTPQGAKIATTDGHKVALVHVLLHAESFESYQCRSNFEAGVNMSEVFKLVKQSGLRDILQWYVPQDDPHKLHIAITPRDGGIRNVFTYNLLDMNNTEIGMPDVDFSFMMTMPSPYLHKLVRAMLDIGDNVTVTYEHKKLTLACEGLRASQTVTVEDSNLAAMNGDANRFSATYPLKYLVSFAKAHTLCPTTEIMMQEGLPLILKYTVGSLGELKFCLANRYMDSDEDED